MIKFLATCLIILSIAYILVFYVFKPKFTITTKGIAMVSPTYQATFFIPADKPIAVYKFDPHPKELTQIIQRNIIPTDSTFGIYLKNLTTNQVYELNTDQKFNSASLYKLFVMYTIFKKGQNGDLDITKPDIQQNLSQMIEVSSNDAAYYLVDHYTSWSEINSDMQNLGLKDTSLITSNSTPQTTPANVGALLELIAQGKAVDESSSKQMITFMSKQQRRDRIPALLPDNIFIINKTGELEDALHDAAIVGTPKNDYILVILSKGSKNPETLKPVMAKMSLEIYNFFENEWKNPPEIL